MRSGIVGVGGIATVVLTVAAWVGIAPPDPDSPVPPDPAVVLELNEQQKVPPPTTSVRPRSAPASSLPASSPPASSLPASSSPTTSLPGDASAFVEELNSLRAAQGVDGLGRRADLDALAQSWATRMAADAQLRHSALIYDVIQGSWVTAGENVGYGPSMGVIFAAFQGSPGHLANMVNPDFTSVGIGVVRSGDVLWTAHLFAG